MPAAPRISTGAIFAVDTAQNGTYQSVGQFVDGDFEIEVDVQPKDTQASGGQESVLAGLKQATITVSFYADYSDADAATFKTHHELWKDWGNGVKNNYRLSSSPGTSGAARRTIGGVIEEFERSWELGQTVKHQIKVRSSGALVKDTVP